MFKNLFKLSNNCISKRCFTSSPSSTTSNFSNLGFPIIQQKIYKFNLDGTLKTKENDQSTLSLKQLEPILNSLSLNENQLYNQPIITVEEQPKEQQDMSSILIKRRKKMSKHKHRKLRKRTRALKKRLGKI